MLLDSRDPDPGRRYKRLYWDHGSGGFEIRDGKPFCRDGPEDGLCAAVSPDGDRWTPATMDSLDARLTWREGRPERRAGKTVRLRITAERARVYSYWFEPREGDSRK